MTEQQNGPSNEGKYIDSIDPEDPEYVRQMQRPAEVKEDIRQMEDRQRVGLIMKTQAFREELEEMINDQIRSGPHPASLLALQQISELILPNAKAKGAAAGGSGPVVPIADIRGVESLNYTKGEKMVRNKTATMYRLLDLFGWSHGFNGLATMRLSQDFEHFLVIPHGLLYNEVTASNLLKVDMVGNILDPGMTTLGLNRTAYALHAALHAARPDIRCVIHVRSPSAVSVSVQNCGLLPLCPEAMSLGEISYYSYSGALGDQEEKDKLTRALGPSSKVMFLRSYGMLVGGESIDEAFLLASNVMTAVDTQLRTIPVGLDNIAMPSEETCKKAQDLSQHATGAEGDSKKKWRRGELEFEALVRQLDNAGYRTGHMYRETIQRRQDKRERSNSEVEIPPASTSAGSYYEDDFKSPLKTHMERQKKTFRTEWLNTPNAYIKEEIEEIGTRNPKKITKWVKGESGDPSSPSVKVENPNQFAPLGENPKELKDKYKSIRKEYYEDHIDAGPQSRILEGVTYDEARQMQDGHVSGTSDTMIVVGAASKGIIQRDHQHNAVVYKTYYAPNPFDNMSEEDIVKYKEEVEGKKEGSNVELEDEPLIPGPDGRLISTNERMEHVRQGPNDTTITTTVVTTHVQQQEQPQQQYLETSLDDLNDQGHFVSGSEMVETAYSHENSPVRETTIDSPYKHKPDRIQYSESENTPKPKKTDDLKPRRTKSERLPSKKSKELVAELQQSLDRRAKDDTAINGEQGVLSSPTKSTSSAEATLDDTERSSRDGSPSKEATSGHESPEKGGDKKKKKFRMPSFSSKKKEKKEKK